MYRPQYCLDLCYFAVCSYCSMDLYSLWSTVGWFPEDSIRLFAAELVLVLCKCKCGKGNKKGEIKLVGRRNRINI
jgi:hypothetical protein